MDLFSQLKELKDSGIPAALCTIIETSGSTPRKAGTKMIVRVDAKTSGSVGGGQLELEVIKDAIEVINTRTPRVNTYKAGKEGQGECRIFIEALPVKYRLIVFGAGHVGQALAEVAADYGFFPILVDPRKDITGTLSIEGAEIRNMDYIDSIKTLDIDDKTFIVVCTPSHDIDVELTYSCSGISHAYLGMIGSRKKVNEATRFLEKKGLSKAAIDNIDMPVGVPIKCETPEEIAISILARLIDIKNS